MASPPISEDIARRSVECLDRHGGNKSAAARELEISRAALDNRLASAKNNYGYEPGRSCGFEREPLPDKLVPVEELLERRKRQYSQYSKAEEARKLIEIRIKVDGPIGICHFGDPHVDDDGTDIAALERHTDICRNTEGMFAANLGDTTNNWVGRLARLYGEQSTSAAEAWQLAEWFVKRVTWLYMIGGNHDGWSGAGDPLKWMLRQTPSLYEPNGVRINLAFKNGREVRINARHDFPGNSMWNPAHGPMKAAQMGWRDHILTCGHKHTSGYGVVKDPSTGVLSHTIQVASYKIHDRFAKERGFPDQHISPAAVTIIDPYATKETGLVQVIWDVEEAAEYLTWKRQRWAA